MQALPITIGEALQLTRQTLLSSGRAASEDAVLQESELLVSKILEVRMGRFPKRAELYQNLLEEVSPQSWLTTERIVNRRASGEPLQYLLGSQVFLNHDYRVAPGVLIPRPETELVVTEVIKRLQSRTRPPKMGIEIGLGSGVISIELLSAFTNLRMIASEVSDSAAAIAEQNASSILKEGASRLQLLRARNALEVFDTFRENSEGIRADFLVSNPPYLDLSDEIETQVLEHEPPLALFPVSMDSLHFYAEISRNSKEFLAEDAEIFVEIPSNRAEQIVGLFETEGWQVVLVPDLTGRSRALVAHR